MNNNAMEKGFFIACKAIKKREIYIFHENCIIFLEYWTIFIINFIF